MSRVVGAVLSFILVTGIARAEQFEMVLDNDEDLCPRMLNLVNKDLQKYGEVKFESHEEFSKIDWKEMDLLGEKFETDICRIYRIATFDINNDGKSEIVVSHSGCYKSQFRDKLYILDPKTFSKLDIRSLTDIRENSIGMFPKGSGWSGYYSVKALPPRTMEGGVTTAEGVAGWIILKPFLYQDTYYLAVTDRGAHGVDTIGNGFVIGKYKSSEELWDLCYFRRNGK